MISKQGENLVFLLGTARSGTTLASVMLNNHPLVRCPPEPWLMLGLEAMGRSSARHPADAPVLYRALREFCDPMTAAAGAREYAWTVYNKSLAESKKKILVDKTPRYYLILPYLKEVFPEARFIVLWRNPLDAAASMKSAWGFDLPKMLAEKQDHLACMDVVLGPRRILDFAKANAGSVHAVQYENLARQPQETMDKLFDWLGVGRAPVSQFDLSGGEFDTTRYGDKKIVATRGPHDKSIGQWREAFSADEIRILLETIGTDLLAAVGYHEVIAQAAEMGVRAGASGTSQACVARMERNLAARLAEYDSAPTYSDLAIIEGQLAEALGGEALEAADLHSAIEHYVRLAGQLSAQIESAEQRLEQGKILEAGYEAKLNALRETQWESGHDRGAKMVEFARREAELSATAAALRAELETLKIKLQESHQREQATQGQMERITERFQSQLNDARQAITLTLQENEARRQADTFPGRMKRLKARILGNGSVVRQAAALVKSAGLSPADMMDHAMEHLARKGLNPKVVFDLGAAKGYWTERFAWRWKSAEFFMIDPLAESEARLKMLCERENRFHYLLTALGQQPATVTMNVTPDLDGSSLMAFPNPNPDRQRQIQVQRIDDLIAEEKLKAPDLVKLDVQGFEMNVLDGGQKMFETAEVFIIEVNVFRFMENCPRVDEIVRYMSDRKFVVYDIAGMLRRPFEDDLGQLDIVFVSERSPLIASNRWF